MSDIMPVFLSAKLTRRYHEIIGINKKGLTTTINETEVRRRIVTCQENGHPEIAEKLKTLMKIHIRTNPNYYGSLEIHPDDIADEVPYVDEEKTDDATIEELINEMKPPNTYVLNDEFIHRYTGILGHNRTRRINPITVGDIKARIHYHEIMKNKAMVAHFSRLYDDIVKDFRLGKLAELPTLEKRCRKR